MDGPRRPARPAARRERFESEEARYASRLLREALNEAANDAFTLEDEGAERMLRQAMLKLTEGRGARDADGRAWVRVLMHRMRHERREHAAYAKLYEDAVARLRELTRC